MMNLNQALPGLTDSDCRILPTYTPAIRLLMWTLQVSVRRELMIKESSDRSSRTLIALVRAFNLLEYDNMIYRRQLHIFHVFSTSLVSS
jgi:hypothetical protein